MYRRILFIFLFVFIQENVKSQNLYVHNYTQKDFGSSKYITSPQNWDVEQDSLGRLYVANSSGVLVFDGLAWNMIPGTENNNLYSIAKAKNETIYAGGRNELGYFTYDSLGSTAFQSLMPLLNKNNIEAGVVESVRAHEDYVFFKNKYGYNKGRNRQSDLHN